MILRFFKLRGLRKFLIALRLNTAILEVFGQLLELKRDLLERFVLSLVASFRCAEFPAISSVLLNWLQKITFFVIKIFRKLELLLFEIKSLRGLR